MLNKIFNVKQIRDWDAFTIANEPIASIDLMERAAGVFTQKFISLFPHCDRIVIFCGLGNNGGDGLAIARMLILKGYQVKVFIVRHSDQSSQDFALNLERLKPLTITQDIHLAEEFPEINPNDLLIDGLFGSGLSRPLDGLSASIVEKINQSDAKKIAIDIPSGLFADAYSQGTAIVKADYTFTFQSPKLAFLLPSNDSLVGKWYVLDIGLRQDFWEKTQSSWYYVDEIYMCSILKTRTKFSHKGSFGHALLIGGSIGKMGAAVLATRACLRTGAGLTTVHIPQCGYEIMQTAVPEAMVSLDGAEHYIESLVFYPEKGYSAIGMGFGLDKKNETVKVIDKMLRKINLPLVLDADALNILAENHKFFKFLPKYSILTPHPKEFERLAGKSDNDFERLDILRDFAVKHQVFVCLKGAHTVTASPEGELFFNSTGNPGMAKGGSGDVLTGIITALLSQHYAPQEAALLGVYLHGLAGDMALKKQDEASMIASDLVEALGDAYQFLRMH